MAVDCSSQQQETITLKEKHDFHKDTANTAITGEQ